MSPFRGPARCNDCRAPIVFIRSPFTGNPRPFDSKPVDASHPLAGVRAFPVLSGKAYRPADLADVLQVQRGCSLPEASSEVLDMPWHLIHECPTQTSQES